MNRISRKNLDALQADVEATLEDVTTATQAHAKAMDRYIQAHRAYVKTVVKNKTYIVPLTEMEYQGKCYKRALRGVRFGDVITFPQSTDDGYIIAGKPYKVISISGETTLTICGEDVELLVYIDGAFPPIVYEAKQEGGDE